MEPGNFNRSFDYRIAKANVRRITVHGTRTVLGVIGSPISIIVAIAAIDHLSQGPNPSSNCLSQGGTDPSC